MIFDRSTWKEHRAWFWFSIVAVLSLIASYFFYARAFDGHVSGGSLPGLIYGTFALLLMIFSALLGLRRRFPHWRIGRASLWLKAHLWFSFLILPLLFFHSGFMAGGFLTIALWLLTALVFVSGILGMILQQYLPRLMTDTVSMETIYDQIPHVLGQILYNADVKVAQAVGSLGFELVPPEGLAPTKIKEITPDESAQQWKSLYLKHIRFFLEPSFPLRKKYAQARELQGWLKSLKPSLAASFHPALEDIFALLEEKRQLETQRLLHHILHSWLFVHVPTSYLLLALSIVHAVSVYWY